MTTLFYLLGYVAVICFAITAFLKIRKYVKSTPLHIRWELYPIPHEGKRCKDHGGSYMEDTDWWAHKHHAAHLDDLIFLIREILFLEATFHHNRPLWYRTYPFHLGLYMLMGGAIILILVAFLRLFGVDPEGTFLTLVGYLIEIMSLVGCLTIVIGGIGLIMRRVSDEGLRTFTPPEHYFDIGMFTLFGLTGLVTWVTNPSFSALASQFVYNLLTFNWQSLGSGGFTVHMLLGYVLMVIIPVTFMSHILLKYFLYHDIRWEDVATCQSEKRQQAMLGALHYNVTWAAKHMNPDGKPKTWVDIATSGYPVHEAKKED